MKTHLKYIEGTSDKFWKIETSGNSYTVTYGKNGTSGVSKSKIFDDEAQCLKEAEKLINEKIKKGYSETGEVTASFSKPKSAKQDNFEEIYLIYEDIVKNKQKESLFNFLDTHIAGNKEKFRRSFKKTHKYWTEYVEIKKGSWGSRSDQVQKEILQATIIAVCDKKEANSYSIALSLNNFEKNSLVEKAIYQYRPDWMTEILIEERRKNDWFTPAYNRLVQLEKDGLVQYDSELFAFSLAKFANTTHNFRNKEEIDCLQFLIENKETTIRNLPLIFDFETDIANTRDWNWQDKNAEVNRVWHQYLLVLIEKGFIHRSEVLEKSMEIQNKNWNNGVKGFFKVLIEKLQPTSEELLALQSVIFMMLQNPTPNIINLGIEYCKKIYESPNFDKESFFEWVEPTLQRADIKSGIKNILQIFEKMAKSDKELSDKISQLTAEIFVVPNLELQERASKLIVEYGKQEDDVLKEKLSEYKAGMLGNVAHNLQEFMAVSNEEDEYQENTRYEYKKSFPKLLNNPVELPKDWNSILFHFGKFISSDETIDTEILWNIFITQRHLFPENHTEQLKPYIKQISKGTHGSIWCSCFKCVTEYFVQSKVESPKSPFKYTKSQYQTLKSFEITYDLVHKVDEKIISESPLPLLSFPTHLPFWVEPKVLVQRIIDYQNAGEQIDYSDLSIAISRMPRENVEEAIPLLEQLKPEYKNLMRYCWGISDEIVLEKESVISKLQDLVSNNHETEKTKIASVWAVAGRTFHPNAVFEEFKKTYLHDVPNVAEPFFPTISFEEKWNEYMVNYQTKEMARTPSWWSMKMSLPDFKKTNHCLLYSNDLYFKGKTYYSDISTEAQFYCLQSITPQNIDPLSLKILTKHQVYDGNNALKTFALSLLQPYNQLGYHTMLLYSCLFFNDKKEVRNSCSDVLYQLVLENRIEVENLAQKITFLLNHRFGIFNRMIDALLMIKDASVVHNDALIQLFEGILSELTLEELPSNFKKLLEVYYDLSMKLKHTPSEKAVDYLAKFSNTSQKKLINNILSLKF